MADAFAAHDEALTDGGREGVTSLHLIESAFARPHSGSHRSIAAKAAAMSHSMVGTHGFVDANRRTAWLLVEILVDRSGYRLDMPDDEPVDDLIVSVATGATGFEDLVRWFQERLVRA